jgi:hypothetical protein
MESASINFRKVGGLLPPKNHACIEHPIQLSKNRTDHGQLQRHQALYLQTMQAFRVSVKGAVLSALWQNHHGGWQCRPDPAQQRGSRHSLVPDDGLDKGKGQCLSSSITPHLTLKCSATPERPIGGNLHSSSRQRNHHRQQQSSSENEGSSSSDGWNVQDPFFRLDRRI